MMFRPAAILMFLVSAALCVPQIAVRASEAPPPGDMTFAVLDTSAQAYLMAMHDCGKASRKEAERLWRALADLRLAYGRAPPPALQSPYWAGKQDRERTLADVASSTIAQLGCGERLLKKVSDTALEVIETAGARIQEQGG